MKYSQKYQLDSENLSIFLNCFSNLVRSSHLDRSGGHSRIVPRVDDETWNKVLSETAYSSGGASESFRRFGNNFRVKSGSVFVEVNPVDSWWHSIERPEEFNPNLVVNAVQYAIGKAEKARDRALRSEKGIVGLIGRFIRIPESIMESVNPEHKIERNSARLFGYVIQIIATTFSAYLFKITIALLSLLIRVLN